MHYPTYEHPTTKVIHVVTDQTSCLCGVVYNSFYQLTRRDLRNIKFKDVAMINCAECHRKLKEVQQDLISVRS